MCRAKRGVCPCPMGTKMVGKQGSSCTKEAPTQGREDHQGCTWGAGVIRGVSTWGTRAIPHQGMTLSLKLLRGHSEADTWDRDGG